MSQSYPRHIDFESVPNFRDLGGYRAHDGRTVAWRRLFRSAAFHKMNDRDMARLKQEISPRAVIDLRSPKDPEKDREGPLLKEIGARHYPIPFSTWPWPTASKRPEQPETAQGVKDLPDFQWEVSAESMTAFLSLLRQEYGSSDGYLKANGAGSSLVDRLKVALLV
jgi:protein tyrosine/serine phosphatase